MVKEFYHTTKDGKIIKLQDITLKHLQSIVKWIERKAIEGLTIRCGGGSTAEDMWYDEETFYGKDALDNLDYDKYKQELDKRFNEMDSF